MKKICKQCQKEFIVADEDLAFYKKMSPTFAGKTFEIPAPTLCQDCRERRRMAFRNESKLYKRKCDATGKEIVSVYSPDKPNKVYDLKYWWSDQWDALQYSQDFDSNKPFFEQFNDLMLKVPYPALFNMNAENSEYCNMSHYMKNSYLVFASRECENTMYSSTLIQCKDTVDVLEGTKLEKCYDCVKCFESYNLKYCVNSIDCSDSAFLFDCVGCHDCFFSSGLRNKDYCIENKQYSKEEYAEEVKQYNLKSRSRVDELKLKYREMIKKSIRKYANIVNSENVSGDDIYNSKNCQHCFFVQDAEDSKFIGWGLPATKTNYDCYAIAKGSQFCYESIASVNDNLSLFGHFVYDSANSIYNSNCHFCQNIFGCVGLRHKQYCIFNKQYSKDEYEELAAQICEKMVGNGEWGEFFPINLSPFGYNETIAEEFYPLEKTEAQKIGVSWQDDDYSLKSDGPFYEPLDRIDEYLKSEDEVKKAMAGIIKCEQTGKLFRILPQEMAFYLENKIPLPRLHYDARYKVRWSYKNPQALYHRQCMCEESGHGHEGRCPNEFETTYAPERPEKVYCESCYQKVVL